MNLFEAMRAVQRKRNRMLPVDVIWCDTSIADVGGSSRVLYGTSCFGGLLVILVSAALAAKALHSAPR